MCRSIALATAAAILFSGCNTYDPEYSQKLTKARQSCKGDEVVGIWVSQYKDLVNNNRQTLLLRPDGTGIMKIFKPNADFLTGKNHQRSVTWNYQGNGVWTGKGFAKFVIRYTGSELLVDEPNELGHGFYKVYVNAYNEAAIDAHLEARK